MIDDELKRRLETVIKDRAQRDGNYAVAAAILIAAETIEARLSEIETLLIRWNAAVEAMR